MSKKIFIGWAFTKDESEKANSNLSVYKELKNKFKVYRGSSYPDINLDDYDVVIVRDKGCSLYSDYSIIKNKPNLTDSELLLLCDSGNLCFGGRKLSDSKYIVHED